MIAVGVVGAAGRMGAEVVRAVDATDDLHLAAVIDIGDSLDRLEASGAQVA
ncbi:MAG: 4-hydroxy-tetrahydrodipicolinate reductase, partial [Candidatus Nanopelagicales bacterium]